VLFIAFESIRRFLLTSGPVLTILSVTHSLGQLVLTIGVFLLLMARISDHLFEWLERKKRVRCRASCLVQYLFGLACLQVILLLIAACQIRLCTSALRVRIRIVLQRSCAVVYSAGIAAVGLI